MFVPNRELGSFLVDARLISRAELMRLLEEDGANLFELIRARALVAEDELTRAAAHVLGIPFGELRHEDINPEALLLVPEPLSRAHSLALYKIEGHTAHVAMLNTDDLSELNFLETEYHLRPVPHLTDRASLKRALLIHQKHLKERFAQKLKSDAAVSLEALVSHALLSRASEIHLEPTVGGQMHARYRIGRTLHDAMMLPAQARSLVSLLKESAGLSLTLTTPQEGRFKILLQGNEAVRLGVNTLPSVRGERVLIHLAREAAGRRGFTLDSLGLHGKALEETRGMLEAPGLVLVASPAGSGKTTALYTMFDIASHVSKLSISIEEEVELPFAYATQVEVRRDLGQTIASAARAALKQHPDVLLISEIKDEETAALALSAASTGALVLAGVKAGTGAKAIEKMLSLDVDPLALSVALKGVLASRVVRKLCPHCKQAYKATRADISALESVADFGRVLASLKADGVVEASMQWKDVQFYSPQGCSECDEGYRGSTAFFEVLPVSAVARELIRDPKREKEEREASLSKEAPLSLAEDGIYKAAAGLTYIEEVADALGE